MFYLSKYNQCENIIDMCLNMHADKRIMYDKSNSDDNQSPSAHWITIHPNGNQGKGRRILIDEQGHIQGGDVPASLHGKQMHNAFTALKRDEHLDSKGIDYFHEFDESPVFNGNDMKNEKKEGSEEKIRQVEGADKEHKPNVSETERALEQALDNASMNSDTTSFNDHLSKSAHDMRTYLSSVKQQRTRQRQQEEATIKAKQDEQAKQDEIKRQAEQAKMEEKTKTQNEIFRKEREEWEKQRQAEKEKKQREAEEAKKEKERIEAEKEQQRLAEEQHRREQRAKERAEREAKEQKEREELEKIRTGKLNQDISDMPMNKNGSHYGVAMLTTDQMKMDPERFQYKVSDVGENGVTKSLDTVTDFDDNLAGLILAWQDPKDGKIYVINGHHRYNLAKRLNHKKPLTVRLIDARDEKEARAIGALTNIADNHGSILDAAKFIRDGGLKRLNLRSTEEAKKQMSSMSGTKWETALNLSKTSNTVFSAFLNGTFGHDQYKADSDAAKKAALFGQYFGDSEDEKSKQSHCMQIFINSKHRFENTSIRDIENTISLYKSGDVKANTQSGAQRPEDDLISMYDPDYVGYMNLCVEMGSIKTQIENIINFDRNLFNRVGKEKNSGILEGSGAARVNKQQAKELAASRERMLHDLEQNISHEGDEIHDIIYDAATQLVGAKSDAQKENTIKNATDNIVERLKERDNAGNRRRTDRREHGEHQQGTGRSDSSRSDPGPGESSERQETKRSYRKSEVWTSAGTGAGRRALKAFYEKLNYIAATGHWITLNGSDEDEEDEEGGGTHVFITSGGHIDKGPAALQGKNLSDLGKKEQSTKSTEPVNRKPPKTDKAHQKQQATSALDSAAKAPAGKKRWAPKTGKGNSPSFNQDNQNSLRFPETNDVSGNEYDDASDNGFEKNSFNDFFDSLGDDSGHSATAQATASAPPTERSSTTTSDSDPGSDQSNTSENEDHTGMYFETSLERAVKQIEDSIAFIDEAEKRRHDKPQHAEQTQEPAEEQPTSELTEESALKKAAKRFEDSITALEDASKRRQNNRPQPEYPSQKTVEEPSNSESTPEPTPAEPEQDKTEQQPEIPALETPAEDAKKTQPQPLSERQERPLSRFLHKDRNKPAETQSSQPNPTTPEPSHETPKSPEPSLETAPAQEPEAAPTPEPEQPAPKPQNKRGLQPLLGNSREAIALGEDKRRRFLPELNETESFFKRCRDRFKDNRSQGFLDNFLGDIERLKNATDADSWIHSGKAIRGWQDTQDKIAERYPELAKDYEPEYEDSFENSQNTATEPKQETQSHQEPVPVHEPEPVEEKSLIEKKILGHRGTLSGSPAECQQAEQIRNENQQWITWMMERLGKESADGKLRSSLDAMRRVSDLSRLWTTSDPKEWIQAQDKLQRYRENAKVIQQRDSQVGNEPIKSIKPVPMNSTRSNTDVRSAKERRNAVFTEIRKRLGYLQRGGYYDSKGKTVHDSFSQETQERKAMLEQAYEYFAKIDPSFWSGNGRLAPEKLVDSYLEEPIAPDKINRPFQEEDENGPAYDNSVEARRKRIESHMERVQRNLDTLQRMGVSDADIAKHDPFADLTPGYRETKKSKERLAENNTHEGMKRWMDDMKRQGDAIKEDRLSEQGKVPLLQEHPQQDIANEPEPDAEQVTDPTPKPRAKPKQRTTTKSKTTVKGKAKFEPVVRPQKETKEKSPEKTGEKVKEETTQETKRLTKKETKVQGDSETKSKGRGKGKRYGKQYDAEREFVLMYSHKNASPPDVFRVAFSPHTV